MSNAIGTIGQIDSITIAGRVITNLTSPIYLLASSQSASGNTIATFRKANATSGYQVTAGKTFTVQAFWIAGSAMTAGDQVKLNAIAQADNDSGWNGSTAITNPSYLGGASNAGLAVIQCLSGYPPNRSENIGFGFTIAATKYISAVFAGAADPISVYLIGTEA